MKLRRFFTAALTVCVLAANFVMPTYGAVGYTFEVGDKTVKVGDYFQMGTYNGEKILWRCVDNDENGILMLSDKILCFKAFDAHGDNTSGSHEKGASDLYPLRILYGSNYWNDSNIKDWLNSDAAEGNVVWSCGNPPSRENLLTTLESEEANVQGGTYEEYVKYVNDYNENLKGYDQEAGFLNDFTEEEKNAIKQVWQKQILSEREYDAPETAEYFIYCHEISEVTQNYDGAYSEITADKVFLPDVKQISNLYNDFGDYYMAHATAAAAAEEKLIAPWNESVYYDYWLRTPETKNLSIVRVVLYNGYIMESSAYGYLVGVRPAFYLDQNAAVITGGSGSETEPYVINGSETDSFVYGDADGNNTVTSSDSSYILQKALIGTFELPIQSKTENWLEYVDVDDNNEVTASDASYVLQKTLVSTFELPAEKNKVK